MFDVKLVILSVFILIKVNAQSFTFKDSNATVDWTVGASSTVYTATFQKPSGFSNGWFAIGINSEPVMSGGNGIVFAISNTTGNSMEHYYFDGNTPILFDEDKKDFGLRSSSITVTSTQVVCKFERENNNNASNYFNSNQDVYILMAWGNGVVKYHGDNRYASESTLNFKFSQSTTRTTSTRSSNTQNTTTSQKGDFNFHFFEKTNMVVYWVPSETSTLFSVEFEIPLNFKSGWAAVGINTVAEMSGTNAVVCSFGTNSSNFLVEHYYFEGYTPKNFNNSKNFGISNQSVSIQDSIVVCSFERENSRSVAGYINSAQNLYFLSAFGEGSVKYHGVNRSHSTEKYDLSSSGSPNDVTPSPNSPDFNGLLNLIMDFLSAETIDKIKVAFNDFLERLKAMAFLFELNKTVNDSNDQLSDALSNIMQLG